MPASKQQTFSFKHKLLKMSVWLSLGLTLLTFVPHLIWTLLRQQAASLPEGSVLGGADGPAQITQIVPVFPSFYEILGILSIVFCGLFVFSVLLYLINRRMETSAY